MSFSPVIATPLPPNLLHNLILILRRANVYYSDVAACIRATHAPTHHAKARAQTLGLSVNIAAAVNCPQKHVSVIPLPIIEVVTPPLEPIQLPVTNSGRPVLTCVIPPVVQTITSPNGTTSSLYSVTLSSGNTANATRSHWSAVDDEDLFPRDATEADSINVRATEQAEPYAVWQPLDVHIDETVVDWELDMQYPVDSSDMDISPCASASSVSSSLMSSPTSASEAGSESSDTSESSVSSFSGPATPTNDEVSLPLMIRIKRKSMEICDGNNGHDISDKRVKVVDSPLQYQRRNVIRIPARK
ncbi:hypothetical protein H0H93_003719 [Arthromyces matolae]|nr:hypothetical protein H0H93_003719 [Arthromyces matolae]